MFKRALLTVALSSLAALSVLLPGTEPASAAANVPEGFDDALVTRVSNEAPIALAFAPDGRLLITTQSGKLLIHREGTASTTQALDISEVTCSNSERGLLGVAVDPGFASNGHVYLYYTYNKYYVCPERQPGNKKNPVNRVSRFTMAGGTVDPDSEVVLIDNIRSPNGNHNAGDLHFGKEGTDQERYLYVSVGDGSCDYAEPSNCQYENDASRDRHILLGKILRVEVDPDGSTSIPPDNPYTGTDSRRCDQTGRTESGKKCQEIFALGLRNPFRMAFDPDAAGTSFRINDVGGAHREEIDRGRAGVDYGWNLCEGRKDNPERRGSVKCGQPPYTPPIHQYSHSSGCQSITGGAFVPNGAWRSSYDDAYLFGDFRCGKIFSLEPKRGGGFARTVFATGL
jgi:glucose/arabinose dehydrogenase